MKLVLASVCWIALGFSSVSAATMTVTTQSRTVSCEANASNFQGEFGHPSESAGAPDFELFNGVVHADYEMSNGYASAMSSQDSWISDVSFSALGSFSAAATIAAGPGYSNASGDSHFRVYFTLPGPADYSFSGLAEKSGLADVSIELKVGGIGGERIHLFSISAFSSETELPFSVEGTLAPANYILYAWTNGTATDVGPGPCSGGYDMSFLLNGATDAPVLSESSIIAASPNPFRHAVRLQLPDGATGAKIFDVTGRFVLQLPGAAVWDGRDAQGRSVPGGVYFVKAEGSNADVARVVRLR